MMKLKFAALSLAAFLYAASAFAQHAHGGGVGGGAMGAGMGNSMGHSSMGSSNANSTHGNPNTTGSSQKPTVNDILSKNPAIGDKITTLTGASSASDACQGFKNLGQCVAAAHVAKNIDGGNFYCLRQAMTGVAAPSGTTCTSTGSMSLGKAIQTLYPQANSSDESKKGQNEATQANSSDESKKGQNEATQDLKASGAKS